MNTMYYFWYTAALQVPLITEKFESIIILPYKTKAKSYNKV